LGALFAGFGLLQYRFLGLQAIFFILIGLLLLYAAAANFVERKKYKLSLRLSITYCVYRVETKRSKEMNTGYKQLTRSTTNHMIAGVCGGLGFYSNIDPTVIRLAAVLLLFLTGPGIVVAYILMALIVPEDPERQT
jgi:phage shock protein C